MSKNLVVNESSINRKSKHCISGRNFCSELNSKITSHPASNTVSTADLALQVYKKEVLDAFISHNSRFINRIQQALILASLNHQQLRGHDANIDDILCGITKTSKKTIMESVEYIRKLPCIKDAQDSGDIIKEFLFDYYLVCVF